MIKIIGVSCLAAICVIVGIMQSKKLYRRVECIEKLIILIGFIISQIKYTAEPFDVIFKKASMMNEFESLEFLLSQKEHPEFESPFILMKKHISEFESAGILKKDEISLLYNLADTMGNFNTDGEIKQLQLYSTLFEEKLASAKKEYSDKGKMFRTLGVLSGAAVFIILV